MGGITGGIGSGSGATSLSAASAWIRPKPVPKSKPVSNPAVLGSSMSIAVYFRAVYMASGVKVGTRSFMSAATPAAWGAAAEVPKKTPKDMVFTPSGAVMSGCFALQAWRADSRRCRKGWACLRPRKSSR